MSAIILEDASSDVEEQPNMEGTLTLFHSCVRALFDTGASNSFIVVRMMNDLGLVPQELKLGKVFKDCPLGTFQRI